MQTKKQSFIESITNTAVGFGISLLATFIIFPLVGVESSAGKNLVITIFFTVISILRSYLLRRYFNKKVTTIVLDDTELQNLQLQKVNSFYDVDEAELYCFECEIETSVKYNQKKYYCANCGLKH